VLEIIIDDFNKVQYGFYFDDRKMIIYLDKYIILYRETKRHGWKISKQYERLDQRHNTIKLEDIPFDDNIKTKAKQIFVDQITVDIWPENK